MRFIQMQCWAVCVHIVFAMAFCDVALAFDRHGRFSGDAALAVDSEAGTSCAVMLAGRIECVGVHQRMVADVPHEGRFLTVSTGERHACAIRSDGEILCWGDDEYGQTAAPRALQAIAVRADATGSCAMRVDGQVICWGRSSAPRDSAYAWGLPDVRDTPQIRLGDAHACELDIPRRAECWGGNHLGQIEATESSLRQIDVQGDHACGVGLDGLVACWGDARHGGSSPAAGTMRLVDVGQFNACGLRGDGSVVCWGWAPNGQNKVPDGRFRAISTGLNHSCGIRDDGTVLCWGYNADGQSSPPAGLFRRIAVGERHACAIGQDAQIKCWGLSSEGQIHPPKSDSGFQEIAIGPFHGCAIRGDGGLNCWGRNDAGQATPPADGRYVAVAAGFAQSCAIRTDGRRICWGHGDDSSVEYREKRSENALSTDVTPPVITNTRTPLNGTQGPTGFTGTYWQRGDVRMTWSVTDPESAITSAVGCEDVDFTYDVFRIECIATSAGGQAIGYGMVLRDVTPPTITSRLGRQPNNWGWYNTSVPIDFTCTDATSGVWWCPNGQYIMQEGAGIVSPVEYASDYAGNGSPSSSFTLNIDKTPPVIVGTPRTQPNAYGWYNQDVVYDFSCTDNLSGFAEGTCPPTETVSIEGYSHLTKASMYDRAGNLGELELYPKIDKTPPLLILNTIPTVAVLNQNITASATFHDSLSGLLSVICTPMDTATIGEKNATCTATDLAGNTATASRKYRVVYALSATQAPLSDRTRVYRVRTPRFATLEWFAKDASGNPVTTVSLARTPSSAIVACPAGDFVDLPVSAATGADSYFDHLGGGLYRYNWWIPTPVSNGCVSLTIELDDGSKYVAIFKVVPKTQRTGGPSPPEVLPQHSPSAIPASPAASRAGRLRPIKPQRTGRPAGK